MKKIEHLNKMELQHDETHRAKRLEIILKAIVLYDNTFMYSEDQKKFVLPIYDRIKYLTDLQGHLIITWDAEYHKGEELLIKKLWDLYGGEEQDNVTSRYSIEYVKNKRLTL